MPGKTFGREIHDEARPVDAYFERERERELQQEPGVLYDDVDEHSSIISRDCQDSLWHTRTAKRLNEQRFS